MSIKQGQQRRPDPSIRVSQPSRLIAADLAHNLGHFVLSDPHLDKHHYMSLICLVQGPKRATSETLVYFGKFPSTAYVTAGTESADHNCLQHHVNEIFCCQH
eukprot:GHUV01013266.1.p1 GENE.GHUV01013266.1~~GHUV01013266.1.p1  ORF type:complete len:102 (-),score=6.36 GHUV01013266.1:899-1204(-)